METGLTWIAKNEPKQAENIEATEPKMCSLSLLPNKDTRIPSPIETEYTLLLIVSTSRHSGITVYLR